MKGYIIISRGNDYWTFREGTVLTQVHPTIEKTLRELISVIKKEDEEFFQRAQKFYEREGNYNLQYGSVEDFILDNWNWFLETEMDIHKVEIALEEW